MSVDVALALKAVTRSYPVSVGALRRKQSLQAVKGVDLTVARGAIQGIVGESGCGKSTLARLMLGLDEPGSGDLLLFGRPVRDIPRRERARLVQPVFQDPYSSLNPSQTIGGIIGAPLEVHGLGAGGGRRKAIEQMMLKVGLSPALFHTYPGQLSGGQRQRVAIARALVLEPQLLICDEPTSALDVSVQAQIINLLQDLHRSLGLTIVLISHNLAVVQHLAHQVAVMYLGRIVERGPSAAIFAAPRHPYTAELLRANPRIGARRTGPLTTLKGEFPDPLRPPAGCEFHPRCANAIASCTRLAPDAARAGEQIFTCRVPVVTDEEAHHAPA